MKFKRLTSTGLLVVSTVFCSLANASQITNGNFATDLSGWSTVTDGGSVVWQSGSAVLTTGSTESNSSAVLVQGDDGAFSFTSPLHLDASDKFLTFNAAFSSTPNSAESGLSSFTDNLQLWLYDANDALGNYFLTSISSSTSLTHFALNIAPYIGKDVALSFELRNYNDGYTSQVALSNIAFVSSISAVPEPSVWLLLAGGLLGLAVKRPSKRIN